MVLVGIIARSHGNRGQVIVNSQSDFPEARFKEGATVFAKREETGPIEALSITSVRFQQGRPILGIDGISSIDEAERLAGAERLPSGHERRRSNRKGGQRRRGGRGEPVGGPERPWRGVDPTR
jgi:ribosomal 30S subunit maturation factor RimM